MNEIEKMKNGDSRAEIELNNKNSVSDPIESLKAKADSGDVEAMCILGDLYNSGSESLKKDDELANKYYTMASEKGDLNACAVMGFKYYGGNGICQDERKGIGYIKKAADGGVAKAQYVCSELYELGKIGCILTNKKKMAYKYCEKAARNGLKEAQNRLGYFNSQGIGCTLDHRKAIFWFCCSYIQGDSDALENINLYLKEQIFDREYIDRLLDDIKKNHAELISGK